MPARLEEAFGSGLNTGGSNNSSQIDDLMSSLASLKNPGFNKSNTNKPAMGGWYNQSGGGYNQSDGGYNQSGGGYNPSDGGYNQSGGGYNQSGGGCPSLPTNPNRPSLDQPYIGNQPCASNTEAFNALKCEALAGSPVPFDNSTGVPKAYNWDKAVKNESQNGIVPQSVQSSLTVGECSGHLQHIWSCAECRNKLKNLLDDSEDTPTPKTMSPNSVPVSMSPILSNLDLPNLVYHLLLGLGLLILLDAFVRLGKRL